MNEQQMPLHVMDWLRQFPGETITIRMAENGNVRIWTRSQPREEQRNESEERER